MSSTCSSRYITQSSPSELLPNVLAYASFIHSLGLSAVVALFGHSALDGM